MDLPVYVLLWRTIYIGTLVFRAPNQGLHSSFCCWTAGQGLAQKECHFLSLSYLSPMDIWTYGQLWGGPGSPVVYLFTTLSDLLTIEHIATTLFD